MYILTKTYHTKGCGHCLQYFLERLILFGKYHNERTRGDRRPVERRTDCDRKKQDVCGIDKRRRIEIQVYADRKQA